MRSLLDSSVLQLDSERHAKSFGIVAFAALLLTGVITTMQPGMISSVWLVVFVIPFYAFLTGNKMLIWYCIAASPGLEVLARMSRAPFVPDEIGKYFLFLAIAVLTINNWKHGANKPLYRAGEMMLLFLLPSVIVGLSVFNLDQWVFNLLAPLELAFLLLLAARERWNIEDFCKMIQVTLMPLVSMLAYLTIKTPNFSKIDFLLVANSSTTGGFGSNQVSTILGMGIVSAMVLQVLKRPMFAISWINYLVIGWFLYRGLLSFSRGGMMAAGIVVFALMMRDMFSSARYFARYTVILTLLTGIGFLTFNKVNEITGNQLLLRYTGETKVTTEGGAVKNLSVISSGRSDVVLSDLKMFGDYPVFGVGPGIAKAKRPQYGVAAIAAHTEFSRLLSEHGIGGMATVFLLCLFPLYWLHKQKLQLWKSVSGALFLLAILSSLHSAMRTNITVVLYTLAAIPVYYFKPYEENG